MRGFQFDDQENCTGCRTRGEHEHNHGRNVLRRVKSINPEQHYEPDYQQQNHLVWEDVEPLLHQFEMLLNDFVSDQKNVRLEPSLVCVGRRQKGSLVLAAGDEIKCRFVFNIVLVSVWRKEIDLHRQGVFTSQAADIICVRPI